MTVERGAVAREPSSVWDRGRMVSLCGGLVMVDSGGIVLDRCVRHGVNNTIKVERREDQLLRRNYS